MPNKRALISVLILWMYLMPVGKGIAQLNTGAWPMKGHDVRHTGQSAFNQKAFGELKWKLYGGSTIAINSDGTIICSQQAINPDGTYKWVAVIGGYDRNYGFSTPAIATDGTT